MLAKQTTAVSEPANAERQSNSFEVVCTSIINKLAVSNSPEEGFNLIQKKLKEHANPIVVSFLNAHGFNICFKDQQFYQSIMASDIVFRDGFGLKILLGMIGKKAGENLNGTDFIPALLQQLKPQRLALIGTTTDVLEVASKHTAIARHNLVFCDHGFRSLAEYTKPIIQAKPTLVVLGMGMPKQEELSVLLKSRLPEPTLIINGGAILDFLGNKVPRAPLALRKIGLEWAFRLAIEPRRLFRRYVIGNAIFLTRAVRVSGVFRDQSKKHKRVNRYKA